MNTTEPTPITVPVSTWTFATSQNVGVVNIIVNYAHLVVLDGQDISDLEANLGATSVATLTAHPVVDDESDDGMFFTPLIIGEAKPVNFAFTSIDASVFVKSLSPVRHFLNTEVATDLTLTA